MAQWSQEVLEKFIAPEICSFTQAEIPDISPEFPQASHWLANHFLNNVLRGAFLSKTRQIVLPFMRTADKAFKSYHKARTLTLEYLKNTQPFSPSMSRYYAAIAEWESFLLSCSILIDIFGWLNAGVRAFQKNDGSKEQRIYTIANQIKHTASCIASGQASDKDLLPVWLANDGLHSYGVVVPYSEVGEMLRDIAKLAEELQDPKTFVQRRANIAAG